MYKAHIGYAVGVSSLLLLLLFGISSISSIAAQPMTPTTTQWFVDAANGNDTNNCTSAASACKTLGAAVAKAAHGGAVIMAAGAYTETDLLVDKRLTIQGAGRDATFVGGEGTGRILRVTQASTITHVTIRHGTIVTPSSDIFAAGGGAILNSTDLTLRHVAISENSAAGSGGAIFNVGNLTIEDSQVVSNTSQGNGGGIYNFGSGTITVRRSQLTGNSAVDASGGAIESYQAVSLTDVTIDNNHSTSFGGGLSLGGVTVLDRVTLVGNRSNSGAAIFATSGAITLTNSTVSGNVATNNYGGLQLAGAAVSFYAENSTIAYNSRLNSAGRGYNGLINNGAVRLVNTIIAMNDDRNCGGSGSLVSEGHNLSNDSSCGLTQTGDQQGVDPLLGPLGRFGGETDIHPLLPGSPAIDTGDTGRCPGLDQRQVARPFDGDGDANPLCDIGAIEARLQLSIADVTITEGDSGTTQAVFTVTLAPTATQSVSVDFATLPGSAGAGTDYTTTSGTLTFDPGQTVKTILVPVIGDTSDELDETFQVQLSNAADADLVRAVATGTVVDDDGLPVLTVDDPSVLEGNSGARQLDFTVTLSPAGTQPVSVLYITLDGSARAGSDYTSKSATLTFAPGETNKVVSINVLGDVVDEGVSEDLFLALTQPAGATIGDDRGVGTITDDDSARLRQTIGPQVAEGDSGLTAAVFTVTLTTPAAFAVTVDYEASSGATDSGAKVGEDFQASAGTLTFPPGETSRTYTVQIIGDTLYEPDETFRTLISNGSVPIDANGTSATILNDDDARIYLPISIR